MKTTKPLRIFVLTILLLLSFSIVNGQDGNKFDEPTDTPRRGDNIRQMLGLTDEQVLQIQLIRRERQPKIRIAQIRQRDARKNLDRAIYADAFDETEVQLYLKDFLEAQAEVTKLRMMNEIAFRKVLTPEQLEKFRNFRNEMQQRRNQRNRLRKQQQQNQNRQRPNRRKNPLRRQ